MRIAICISGQARTWKKCFQNWAEKFHHQGDVDYFFHFWDYNTLPSLLATYENGPHIADELLSDEEKQEIITAFNPKLFMFEPRKQIDYWNCDLGSDQKIGGWCTEQFYSLYQVSMLKRQYEMEHKFRYDLVIRLRADLMFLDESVVLRHPDPNVLYTSHCAFDHIYNVYRVGDIHFYADSYTFDQVALFYKFLSFVPVNWVTPTHSPPPEIALYFYLASIGILNYPTHPRIKVSRDDRVLQIKGKLDGYEIV
jgi:hypothetical protein